MIIELTKADYKKLEDYIENLDKYRKELKFREYELLSNHEIINPDGGKPNIVINPTERQVIKLNTDAKYRRLYDVVKGTEEYLDQCDEETLKIFNLKYWNKPPSCNTWDAIAHRYHYSLTSILRWKTAQLNKLADKIGHI
ncbi:transcriptional regulator [Staphylococcus hyicus]|uniref:transcriptional regulator n=1 Tax=Staphylococcus hyicus TaxID=1284 RepID=UPI000D1EDC0D|nr:transcriptional regulator [Staphylococcus hyicus]NJH82531.1 transcriptional regulator [Staphylococcus hyicus]PTJ72038.1 transcriptional regulator [Staphylococcus hyicus]PTJ88173.1 transcriptional regulator [Staphylococcus hyicus]